MPSRRTLLAATILALAGCGTDPLAHPAPRAEPARGVATIGSQPLHILAVGDSITAGAGSSDGTGYRSPLAALLTQRGRTAHWLPAWRNGAMVDTIGPDVDAALAAGPPDIALVALGTNDSAWAPLDGWATRYAALVDRILGAGPQVRVAVARITYSAATAAVVRQRPHTPKHQRIINGVVGQIAAQRPGRVAVAGMDTIPSGLLTDGGWHPGDEGYRRMAEIWAGAIDGWI